MMGKKNYLYLIIVFFFSFSGVLDLSAQEITFLEGEYDEALKQAKQEGKPVFIDFYATWCGPCKVLAQTVFTDPEIKAYYDGHFVCLRVDVDKEKKLANKYEIMSMPTLVFLNSKGKEVKRFSGLVHKKHFLNAGQEVCGERPTLPEMYKQYQKNERDLQLLQTVLLETPFYVEETPGVDGKRWKDRMFELFPKYVQMKGLAQMVNSDDFELFLLYNPDVHRGDSILNFLNARYKEFEKVVAPKDVWQYVISKQGALINQLAKAGDLGYQEELKRVDGDMKEIYSKISDPKLAVYDAMKNHADALYALYAEKDEAKYLDLKENYFTQIGDFVSFRDYQDAIRGMVIARLGKLEPASYERCLVWLERASRLKLNPQEELDACSLKGSCFMGLKRFGEAKACFNQAYVLAMQLGNQRSQMEIKAALEKIQLSE